MRESSRFEDLIAWQKARALVRAIYIETRKGDFARDYALARQIQRAAISITSNIAEGVERTGLGEFQQFLTISKASCVEVRSQLYNAYDVGYLSDSDLECLLGQAEEVARIIGGLRASIQKTRNIK